MRYLLLFAIAVITFNCSPKLAPDANWGRGRWVLVQMKGVPVQQSGSRRDAYLDFNTTQKLFTGVGGCNQLNGSYTIDKNSIQFRDVSATKMLCSDMDFEKVFLEELAHVNRYELKGDDLLLKKKKEVVLILRAR
jgi:heat shock protein HslJ